MPRQVSSSCLFITLLLTGSTLVLSQLPEISISPGLEYISIYYFIQTNTTFTATEDKRMT